MGGESVTRAHYNEVALQLYDRELKGNAGRSRTRIYAENKKGGPRPAPTEKCFRTLLGGFFSDAIEGERKARLVTVAGVFVQHALGDGLVDRGHRRM